MANWIKDTWGGYVNLDHAIRIERDYGANNTYVVHLPNDKSVRVTMDCGSDGMDAAVAQLVPAAAGQEAILVSKWDATGSNWMSPDASQFLYSRVPIVAWMVWPYDRDPELDEPNPNMRYAKPVLARAWDINEEGLILPLPEGRFLAGFYTADTLQEAARVLLRRAQDERDRMKEESDRLLSKGPSNE